MSQFEGYEVDSKEFVTSSFTFQYESIRRLDSVSYFLASFSIYISIWVNSKVLPGRQAGHDHVHLHFNMSQFEGPGSCWPPDISRPFTFQYESIRRSAAYHCRTFRPYIYISIWVNSKVNKYIHTQTRYTHLHFNMSQFEGNSQRFRWCEWNKFTFQYESIRRPEIFFHIPPKIPIYISIWVNSKA